jgi:hypothetical protein
MAEQDLVDRTVILGVLQEVENEIRQDGVCPKERALLYHQLGSLWGLMGDRNQQRAAWQMAVDLDPQSEIFWQSLAILSH